VTGVRAAQCLRANASMTNQPDDESRVESVRFDRATHTLRIEFETGPPYDFADVPERIYDELARTPTPDEYFRAHVQNEFAGSPSDEIDLAELANERREDAVLGSPFAAELDAADDDRPGDVARSLDTEPRESRHTWIVDVLDDDAAAIEVDGRRITPVPRWLLPADAQNGDVLRVTHLRTGSRSTLAIDVDHDATRRARDRSARHLRDAPPGGSGDVDLGA